MKLADAFAQMAGPHANVRFVAYDGSKFGSDDAPVMIELRTPEALRYLVRSPGALGLPRAFITGGLDIHGDIYTALREMTHVSTGALGVRDRMRILRLAGPSVLGRAKPPPQEIRLRGRRHSKARDKAAVEYHYDVSNRFYEIVLGRTMGYTCGVYTRQDATTDEAQDAKFDLVCRKLGLEPGMRLLDVGCGWGGMMLHAARHYGVRVVGVTLSRYQADYVNAALDAEGLTGAAEVRLTDYRDMTDGGYDAVSSIGLTEHIGRKQLPGYFGILHRMLRPGGRLLNQCITRASPADAPSQRNGFINRYVFPDGELSSPGHVHTVMEAAGFEVRHIENFREHYVKTLAGWCANLTEGWDEAVREAGEHRARIWALYMAGSRLGFEQNHLQLHQFLGVRTEDGASGMPLRPAW